MLLVFTKTINRGALLWIHHSKLERQSVNMSFQCNECDKNYQWRHDLARHKRTKHKNIAHQSSNQGPMNGVMHQQAIHRQTMNSEPLKQTENQMFKFKHPFCMQVVGPSRSGKTEWVIKLLEQKRARIEPSVDQILYCYRHWQDSYNTLKPIVQFHKGLPSALLIEKLQNGLIVLDDLMDDAVKDHKILSTFTEGSHHKRLSVIFLMQNIFHKGLHTRTINLNVQYMILFKNARDQQQIQTLARQMFPNGWRKFLEHYEEATGQLYGHVILDLHPSTPDENRIVHEPSDEKKTTENNFQDLMKQHYSLLNPYADPLLKAKQKMDNILEDPNIDDGNRQVMHGEATDEYLNLLKRYELNQPASGNVALNKFELVKEYKPELVNEYKPLLSTKRKYEEPELQQFKPEERSKRRNYPPGIPKLLLRPEEVLLPSDDDDDDWEDARDGENSMLLSLDDTKKEREEKIKYTDRLNSRPPPSPNVSESEMDPTPLSLFDAPEDRQKKMNFTKKYHLRSNVDKDN